MSYNGFISWFDTWHCHIIGIAYLKINALPTFWYPSTHSKIWIPKNLSRPLFSSLGCKKALIFSFQKLLKTASMAFLSISLSYEGPLILKLQAQNTWDDSTFQVHLTMLWLCLNSPETSTHLFSIYMESLLQNILIWLRIGHFGISA